LSQAGRAALRELAEVFSPEDAGEIKATEAITNHDVKAVEYFIKKRLEEARSGQVKEWVHFGLTSQDINNTAVPLSWKHAIEFEYLPSLLSLTRQLGLLADEWKAIP